MKIGAHVSASGGFLSALRRGDDIGVETLQLFNGSPRVWSKKQHLPEEIKNSCYEIERRHWPVFIHGIYLINLASNHRLLYNNSVEALTSDLAFAEAIGAQGVVFHIGSHGTEEFTAAAPRAASAIEEALKNTRPKHAKIIIENSARGGGKIGWNHEQLKNIYREIDTVWHRNLGFCLDTCHAFASGYDIRDKTGVENWLRDFDRQIGLEKICVFHGNDSKAALGSGLDRHENIGRGAIGIEAFESLLNQKICQAPLVIEVPGYKGTGPDRENIDLLKSLRYRSPTS